MERLCDYGYVDDAAYCRTYFRQAARRGKGRRRIERELQQKGVAPAVITDALDAMIDEASASSGADAEGAGGGGYAEDSWASDSDARLYDEAARALDVAEKMRRQQLAAEKKVDEAFLARVGRRLYALGYAQGLIYHVLHTLRDRA